MTTPREMPNRPMPPPPDQPGAKLDAWLAEYMMGWLSHTHDGIGYHFHRAGSESEWRHSAVWTPSSSTAIALDEVAEKMKAEGFELELRMPANGCLAKFWYTGDGDILLSGIAWNKNKAAAVCLAAAKALYATHKVKV